MAQNTLKFFNNLPDIKETLKNRSLFLEVFFAVLLISILIYLIVAVLNPSEIIRQSRDSQRMVEIIDLSQAINLEKVGTGNKNFGLLKTIYISIPYGADDCGYFSSNPLDLPVISEGWRYSCVPASRLRNVDGTGWMPLNLSNESASMKQLPIDPVNSGAGGFFYSYYPGIEGYKVTAKFESKKHGFSGKADNFSAGTGNGYGILEKGTDLNIAR